jgi:fatty-acyl-CoA synthase
MLEIILRLHNSSLYALSAARGRAQSRTSPQREAGIMFALVTDAIRWWTKARPDAPSLIVGKETLTYRQLNDWTDRLAFDLAQRGVKPGDVIAIIGTNSLEWCVAAIAGIKVGAIVAPFSFRFTSREIGQLIDDCRPKIVFVDGGQGEKLRPLSQEQTQFQQYLLSDIRRFQFGSGEPFELDLSPTSPIVIVYTSGTTGSPKGVIYTHQTTLAFIMEIALKDPFVPEDLVILTTHPLFTLAGIPFGLLNTFARGGLNVVMPSFDPAEALRHMQDYRVSYMGAVPVIWEQISRIEGFEDLDLSHLKFAFVGGARVSVPLLEKYSARGVALRQLYGMTEVGGIGTIPRVSEALRNPAFCGDGSIFTKFKVVRPDATECDVGETGEIIMKGPAMTPGYWNNEKGTSELIRAGWIYSGDLGFRDADGCLKFVDRKKDMIISGGFNISPTEVENVIGTQSEIDEVAVIPVKDEKWGETPAAIIYSKTAIDISALITRLNRELADYKVPRYVIQVQQPLPRMLSGKINKRDLTERYTDAALDFERVR